MLSETSTRGQLRVSLELPRNSNNLISKSSTIIKMFLVFFGRVPLELLATLRPLVSVLIGDKVSLVHIRKKYGLNQMDRAQSSGVDVEEVKGDVMPKHGLNTFRSCCWKSVLLCLPFEEIPTCHVLPALQLRKASGHRHGSTLLQPSGLEGQQANQWPSGRLHLHPQRDPQRHGELPLRIQPHPQVLQLRVSYRRHQERHPSRGAGM